MLAMLQISVLHDQCLLVDWMFHVLMDLIRR